MKREMLDKLITLICATVPDWPPTRYDRCNKLIRELHHMCPSVEELAHAAKSKIDWANQINTEASRPFAKGDRVRVTKPFPYGIGMARSSLPAGAFGTVEEVAPNLATVAFAGVGTMWVATGCLELAPDSALQAQIANLRAERDEALRERDAAQKELARVVGVNREIDCARDVLAKERERLVKELAESKKWGSRLQEELNVAIANKNDYRFEREKLAEELDAARQELTTVRKQRDLSHSKLASKNEELAEFRKFVEDMSEERAPALSTTGVKVLAMCQKYGLKWRGYSVPPLYPGPLKD